MKKETIVLVCILFIIKCSYAQNTFPANGNVGVGTAYPRAVLDVGKYINNGTLGTVLARQLEGDAVTEGTFLGVKAWETQNILYGGKSFSLDHYFYGELNSSINFYRGGAQQGGFMTFATSDGTERMRIAANGNIGVGMTAPAYRLDVNGNGRFSCVEGAAVIGIHNIPLASNSYDRGNFEARVTYDDFTAGARPGYGFHAGGRLGIFLYAEGAMDLRLKGESGQDATLWTSVNFTPSNYLPLKGGGITGDLIIGSNEVQKQLLVNGNIKTRKVKVTQTDWADYVFDSSYQLAPLSHVERFIQENKHLPEVPSAAEVKKVGVDIGDNQVVLLKKIEELTLYIIQQNKQIEKQNSDMQKLKAELEVIKASL